MLAGLTGTGAANPFWAQTTADVLGLDVGFCEQVHTGGCSAAGCVVRAAAAIDYGLCDIAFLLFADTHVLEDKTDHSHSYRREWTDPYGLMGPPGAFGLLSRAYEANYGLDYRMLGKIAVTQRNHALLNENACEKLRVPITIDDYLNSRIIADPIRLLDCVMRADGAAGLIMMSRKRAKEKGLTKNIIPIGYAERTNFKGGENLVDVTKSGHEVAARKRSVRPAWASRISPRSTPTTISSSPSCCSSKPSASANRAKACPISASTISLSMEICHSIPAAVRFPRARPRARRTISSKRCGSCAAKRASAR